MAADDLPADVRSYLHYAIMTPAQIELDNLLDHVDGALNQSRSQTVLDLSSVFKVMVRNSLLASVYPCNEFGDFVYQTLSKKLSPDDDTPVVCTPTG